MNAPFANLFIALQQQIATEVPDVVHIAHNLGQLSDKQRPPVSWPCVLLDFEDFKYTNLSENVQTAKGTVVVTLGFAQHSRAAHTTPEAYLQKALSYYDTEWQLHKALQGWSPSEEQFGSLSRTSVTTTPNKHGYRVRELRYTISFDDYSTKPTQQYTPATLIVNQNLNI